MQRPCLCLIVLSILIASAFSPASAQNVNASLSGSVTDQSGAAVPNAAVELRSVETGIVLRTTSGAAGVYTLPNLPPGNYELHVSAGGFRDYAQTGIRAALSDRLRIDVNLIVGAASQTVDVQANASPLNFENAAQGGDIAPATVANLPLLVSGGPRSAAAFVVLLPGVTSADGNVTGVHINGGVQGGGEAVLNGVSMVNPSGGNGIWSAYFDFPQSPDMVSELRVLDSNYEPEYGSTGGSVFIMETKSGTNDFHGGLFEYHRNTALNARQFGADSRPQDLENDFGGALGGPVKVPIAWSARNKTYFFISPEYFRISGGILRQTLSIPSMQERQGDFSDWKDANGNLIPIYDPASTRVVNGQVVRSQFMGCDGQHPNVICANDPRLQASLASGWLKYLPTPTASGPLNNFQPPAVPAAISSNANFLNMRFDEYIGDRDHFTVTLFKRDNLAQTSHLLPLQLSTDLENYKHTWLNRVNYDHIFSPTVLNHFAAGYTDDQYYGGGLDAPSAQQLPMIPGVVTHAYAPAIRFSDGFAGYGTNTGSAAANRWPDPAIVSSDLVTWVRGQHTLKLGMEYRHMVNSPYTAAGGAGQFNFSGTETGLLGVNSGSPIASFLLGGVDSASLTQRSVNVSTSIQHSWIAHIGDTWKLRPNLTVSYGIRWEMVSPSSEKHDVMSFFNAAGVNTEAGGRAGNLAFAGTRWGGSSFGSPFPEQTFYGGFGPRLGIAYSPDSKTVVRTGYGIFYDAGYYSGWYGGVAQDGFNASPAFGSTMGGLSPAFLLAQGFPQNYQRAPDLDPGFLNGQYGPNYRPKDGNRLPYTQQWNFTIEREVRKDFTASVAYVGNKGTRLLSRTAPLNALNPALLSHYGSRLYDEFQPGQSSLDGVAAPYAGWAQQMTACAPSVAQALLPYPQYCGPLQGLNENAGNSTYHSLQLKAEKRLSNGLWFLASYTFSKLITDADNTQPDALSYQALGGAISPFERQRNKGLALEDVPQTFSLAASYDLPFGRHKRWLSSNRFLDYVVGGWTVSSILRFSSGIPFYFRSSTCNIPGQFVESCIPGVLSGANPFAQSESGFDPAKPLFNVNAFEPAGNFNFYSGSGTRVTNLRAFGTKNQDLLFSKTIPLTERFSFEVRGEAFNLWNNHIFRNFTTDIASPSFGMWNTVSNPRNVQVGARLMF